MGILDLFANEEERTRKMKLRIDKENRLLQVQIDHERSLVHQRELQKTLDDLRNPKPSEDIS